MVCENLQLRYGANVIQMLEAIARFLSKDGDCEKSLKEADSLIKIGDIALALDAIGITKHPMLIYRAHEVEEASEFKKVKAEIKEITQVYETLEMVKRG
jgi:hypothetical protein